MSARTVHRPIAPTDRVSDVLARDDALVETFVRLAPYFAKLRNRAMRRVMARLVTVEQAARMAGVSPEVLVRDLNGALGLESSEAMSVPPAPLPEMTTAGEADRSQPESRHPAHARTTELDVRDGLRAGEEPFSRIMAAVSALAEGDVMHLRTIFEPVPLYAVLGKRGFRHEAQARAHDDWSVWFWRPAGYEAEGLASSPRIEGDRSPGAGSDTTPVPGVVELDVRGMEPPEPLLRTLAALETLPAGHTLMQVNARVPQFLIPILAERGFACEIDDSDADRVLVRMWRPA